MTKTKCVMTRLLDNTTRDPVNGCWEFQGQTDTDGYGRLRVAGRKVQAHRASYSLFCGDPGGLQVLHSCDNPRCVKPTHLSPGTNAANHRQKAERGRSRNGGSGKAGHALEVRQKIAGMLAAGASKREIARVLGVSRRTLLPSHDRRRKTYSLLPT
jgi:hypothetical protein